MLPWDEGCERPDEKRLKVLRRTARQPRAPKKRCKTQPIAHPSARKATRVLATAPATADDNCKEREPRHASSDDRAVSPRSGAPFDAVDARRRRRTHHGTRGCGGCSFERRRRPQTNVIPRSWPSSARFAGSDDPREFRLARCAARKERLGWVPGFGHAPALPVGLLTTREPPRIRDVRTKSLRSTTPLKCARPRGVCAPPAGHTPAKSRARGKTKKPRLPRCEPFAELVNRGFNFPRPSAARVPQCE